MKYNEQNKNQNKHVSYHIFICPMEYWQQFKFDIEK